MREVCVNVVWYSTGVDKLCPRVGGELLIEVTLNALQVK